MDVMEGEADGVKGRIERFIWRRWRKAEWRDFCCWRERRVAAACRVCWRLEIVERVVDAGRLGEWRGVVV